ncbi:MAG: B12-binding domain-containing radical SAM protein [Nanoarchaeota archaeon]|nr:B12-binding domain-containing radical SAM protein [Nanoarchaeota archaeon]
MNILLMNPPMKEKELFTESSKETASIIPPLGLAYLAGYMEKQGHEVRIWDGFVERQGWEKVAELAKDYDLLGIHVLSSFVVRAYEFARYLKERLPDKPIVLGGCHVSAVPQEALSNPWVDYVVVGEGEETLTELCEAICGKRKLDTVKGIGFKVKGKMKFNEARPFIEDIDKLPFPARHLFNWKLYRSSGARRSSEKRDMGLLTSRGCPFSCSFCSKDVTGMKIRNFSIPRVMAEIRHMVKEYGVQELAIWDETFTTQRSRVMEFCDCLKKEGLNITWTCSSRVDRVDQELLSKMKKSGCTLIAYGIESGNDDILKKMNKRTNLDLVRKAVKATKKAGIPVRGYFMVGLWGDTPKTIDDTINFAKELDPDVATFTMMVPLPNTLDYFRACRQKNFQKEYWKHRMFPEFNFLEDPIYVPEGMTQKQLIRLHKKAYHSFYFRPRYLLRQVTSIRSFGDLSRLIAGAKTVLKL